jgi:hypothetical protein
MPILRLSDLINEMSKIDAIFADTVHTVKTFDRPSTDNILTLKVINKLKEKRNNSKNDVNKSALIQLITKLEKDYRSGKSIKL